MKQCLYPCQYLMAGLVLRLLALLVLVLELAVFGYFQVFQRQHAAVDIEEVAAVVAQVVAQNGDFGDVRHLQLRIPLYLCPTMLEDHSFGNSNAQAMAAAEAAAEVVVANNGMESDYDGDINDDYRAHATSIWIFGDGIEVEVEAEVGSNNCNDGRNAEAAVAAVADVGEMLMLMLMEVLGLDQWRNMDAEHTSPRNFDSALVFEFALPGVADPVLERIFQEKLDVVGCYYTGMDSLGGSVRQLWRWMNSSLSC